jgi:hypothetical protein
MLYNGNSFLIELPLMDGNIILKAFLDSKQENNTGIKSKHVVGGKSNEWGTMGYYYI